MVEEHVAARTRGLRELGAGDIGRVSPSDLRPILVGRVLRVVDEGVAAVGQRAERRVDAREVLGVRRVDDALPLVLDAIGDDAARVIAAGDADAGRPA